jgi:hypothetical protein
MPSGVSIHREDAKRIIKETLVLYEQRLKYWDDINQKKYPGWELTDQTKELIKNYQPLHRINLNRSLDSNNYWNTINDFQLSDTLCKCVILADLYKLEVSNLPDLSWAQGDRSPFIIINDELPINDFALMLPVDQLRCLEQKIEEEKDADLGSKGRKAAELRNLVQDMKLNGLFALKPVFMNKTLRDFLNRNDNGSEDYTWGEIKDNPDWVEFPSFGAMYHQTTANDEHIVCTNVHGKSFPVYTRLNAKFCNKIDGREVVFRYKEEKNGEQVRDDIDKGTYNYSGRGVVGTTIESRPNGEHQIYDVEPYNKEYLSKATIRWNDYLGFILGNSIYWEWMKE